MTTYHSKRGPVEGCPQPDEPIRERAWADGQKAMRYRDEQARCGCTYMCKFCRDEQEKQV